jgi:hypothetical protein
MVNLIMMDADLLQEFQAQTTLTHKAEAVCSFTKPNYI